MKLLASASLTTCLLFSSLALAEGAEKKAPADAPAAASTSQLGDLSFFPARYQFVDDFSAEYGSVKSTIEPTGQNSGTPSVDFKITTMRLKNRLEYSFFPKQAVLLNLGYTSQKNTFSDEATTPTASSSASQLQGPEVGYKVRFIETALLNLDVEALYDTGLLSKEITYEHAGVLTTPRTPLWKGSKFTAAAHISGRLNESFEYSVTPYFVHHGKQKLKVLYASEYLEIEAQSSSDFGINLGGLYQLTNQFALLGGAQFQRNDSTSRSYGGNLKDSFSSYNTLAANVGFQMNVIPNRVVTSLNFSYLHDTESEWQILTNTSKTSSSGWNSTVGVKVAL